MFNIFFYKIEMFPKYKESIQFISLKYYLFYFRSSRIARFFVGTYEVVSALNESRMKPLTGSTNTSETGTME